MPKHFSEGIYLSHELEEVTRIVNEHKDKVDLVILNSHMGYPQDIYLAKKIKGINIILSAHTHNRLEIPTLINDTIIIQSGSHGSFVGLFELEMNDKIKYKQLLIKLDTSIKEDVSVLQII